MAEKQKRRTEDHVYWYVPPAMAALRPYAAVRRYLRYAPQISGLHCAPNFWYVGSVRTPGAAFRFCRFPQ